MFLVDLESHVVDAESFSDIQTATEDLWSYIFDKMDQSEILWVFAPNFYSDDRNVPTAMEIAEVARSEASFYLKNIITVHRNSGSKSALSPSYEEILFFVKDKDEYTFDKDRIRVENVYEGEEWNGLREESQSAYRGGVTKRYNPDGKDPGNVWLSEHRDETSGQVVDRTSPWPDSKKAAANRCIRASGETGELVKTVWASEEVISAAKEEGHTVETLLAESECVDALK